VSFPQPHRAQWIVICAVTLLLLLAWPPAEGRSLGVKLVNWIVDPRGSLPPFPEPLSFGLEDNGDAVAEHDALERDFYHARDRSATNRWRMDMKEWIDPIAPQTERQVLVGIAVLAALITWRLGGTRTP
jgi:hypothetical protein